MYSCECVFVEFLCNKILHKKTLAIERNVSFIMRLDVDAIDL